MGFASRAKAAREDAESRLHAEAAKLSTKITAMSEPVVDGKGVRVDAKSADGRKWQGWSPFEADK